MQQNLLQKEQFKKQNINYLIGNKIADKITSFPKKSPKELHSQSILKHMKILEKDDYTTSCLLNYPYFKKTL